MKTIQGLMNDAAVRLAADELAEVDGSIAAVRERMTDLPGDEAEARAERQMLEGRLAKLLERRDGVAIEHRHHVGNAAARMLERAAGLVVEMEGQPEQRDAVIGAQVLANIVVESGHGCAVADKPGLVLAGRMQADDPALAGLAAQATDEARSMLSM